MKDAKEPATLQEAILYFSSPGTAAEILGSASMAERCYLPALRKQQGCVPAEVQSLAVRESP